MYKLHTTHHKI